jgi:Raf kinase inhibitor-like YbhB/YbcL family protein
MDKADKKHYRAMYYAAAIFAFFLVSTALSKGGTKMNGLTISSPVFHDNSAIPAKYTCDGKDVNPPLRIDNVPPEAKSLVLIVDDPDAPKGAWVHWVVWNIDPGTNEIQENTVPRGAQLGVNDFKRHDFGGPCPPSGTHRYFFKLYALDTTLNLPKTTKKVDVEKAMEGHIIARSQVMGLYKKK